MISPFDLPFGKWQITNFVQACLPQKCTYMFSISGGKEATPYNEPVSKTRCKVGSQSQGITPCSPTDVAVVSIQQNRKEDWEEVVLRLQHRSQNGGAFYTVEGNITAIMGVGLPRSFVVVPTSVSAVA